MSDFTYLSRYQNLHMDRANPNAMKTVNITFNTNKTSSSTPILLYQYEHGYDYTPQFWGLWDVTYSASLGGATRRGYGYMIHNTGGGLIANFYYTVDAQYVNLYFHYETAGSYDTSDTTATFTGYVFANDRESQDYIS